MTLKKVLKIGDSTSDGCFLLFGEATGRLRLASLYIIRKSMIVSLRKGPHQYLCATGSIRAEKSIIKVSVRNISVISVQALFNCQPI